MPRSPDEDRPLPAPLPRRFTGGEVDTILRRASLVETGPIPPSPHDATLDDLMAAAAEAGMDPAVVRRAAAVAPPAPDGPIARIAGASDRREISAYLGGASIPDDRAGLVRALERLFGHSGAVAESTPDLFVWRARGDGRLTVELTASEGGTELRLRTERGARYLGLWLLGLAVWAAASALTPLGALGPLGFVVGLLTIPVLVARPLWVRSDRALRRRLEHGALELARVVEEAGAGGDLADP